MSPESDLGLVISPVMRIGDSIRIPHLGVDDAMVVSIYGVQYAADTLDVLVISQVNIDEMSTKVIKCSVQDVELIDTNLDRLNQFRIYKHTLHTLQI